MPDHKGKRVEFDTDTWQALDLLARERMMTFQELADEAFRDVLRKHGRPYDTRDAFKLSAKEANKEADKAVDQQAGKISGKQRPKKKTARHGRGRARS